MIPNCLNSSKIIILNCLNSSKIIIPTFLNSSKIIIPNCLNSSKIQEQMVERGKIDTPKTHIHDNSLSWLGTGMSIRSGWVKTVLWLQISPLSVIK
jgi:hypothetical protein